MQLFIYGAGGAGAEILDIAKRIHAQRHRWESMAFVDDVREEPHYCGLPILRFAQMQAQAAGCECVIAQGEPVHRQTMFEKLLAAGVRPATLVDPRAIVSESARIEAGAVIWPGAFISNHTNIGRNAMVQVNTVIGHNITVGEHSVVSSCVAVGGGASIGALTFVGMGSAIKEKTRIGDQCIIGMNSSVFTPVDDGLIALGNPARAMRKNEDQRVFGGPAARAADK